MRQPASPGTLAPGTVLTKRYRIDALIGSGGYASVYRATDLTFGYERAIKEVSDPDPAVRTQFRLEAELLINSKHPNIPHGYHIIEDMGRLYLVMDYVNGKDIEELLNESLTQRQRPLEEAQVLRWALDICSALDEMHNLKVPVIHRDIKPANIKITPDGRPILIDFGLAKLHQREKGGPTMTAAQGVSPGFAPPEQYMAKGRTDARTDVYGLGATLYACLTGKDPPEAPGRLLAQTGAGGTHNMQLVAPRRLNPRISEETDRIIVRALELSPNNRQVSAHQLHDELATALHHLTGSFGDASPALGVACARCGTQNRADAVRCVQCGSLLRATGAGDTSGKRAAVSPVGAARAAGGRPATPAALDVSTGRQPAIADQRSAKQAAVLPMQQSGKQRAVAARAGDAPAATNGTLAAMNKANPASQRAGTAVMPSMRDGAIAPLPGKAQRDGQTGVAARGATAGRTPAAPGADNAPARSKQAGSWIRLGDVALTGFGKTMLALATIEALWGAIVLGLGILALVYNGAQLPIPQLVIGWLVCIVLGSILGAQALSRPVFRRGRMTKLRRWVQGAGITVYSLAVQGAGAWGAYVFATSQSNPQWAVVSYALFGISALIAGIVGIATTLG